MTSAELLANKHTSIVKAIAKDLGFDFCGISKAEQLSEEAFQLENWLNKGMHGQMSYMENHFDKRIDPRQLVPGAKSVISLLFNYYTDTVQDDPESPKENKIDMYTTKTITIITITLVFDNSPFI